MILERYVIKEIARPFTLAVLVLALVFSSYSAAEFLAGAATGLLRPDTVAFLILLKTVIALETLLPIAMFLTVVITLGRLHGTQEIAAMSASGFGRRNVLLAVGWFGLSVAGVVGVLSLLYRPLAYQETYRLKNLGEVSFDLSLIRPGQFYSSPDGGTVVLVDELDHLGERLQGVFVYRDDGEKVMMIRAREASPEEDDEGTPYLLLTDLSMHLVKPSGQLVPSEMGEFKLYLDTGDPVPFVYRRKAVPTIDLMYSRAPKDTAEFQWRLSRPLSAFLLSLLAVVLGHGRPRRDRFGRTILAILVYIAYNQVSIAARTWVEQGSVSSFPGLWWVDAGLALFLFVIVSRQVRAR